MLFWSDILWPMIASVMLVAIHSYLGIHVLARQVIFVDLALAQIASLGGVYAVILGLSLDRHWFLVKLISAVFTIFGAMGFALSRKLNKKVPHEALIGIFYAFSLSIIFILSSNLPHGAEEIRQMFSGSILWISPKSIFLAFVLYLLIAIFHIIFREKFFALIGESNLAISPKEKTAWDFLFYVSLGVVVTSSVGIAGVLLVFAYLVIPACIGMLLSKNFLYRLLWGFLFGSVASFIGIYLSFILDWPTGPSIIIILCSFLLIVIFYRKIWYLLLTILILTLLLYLPMKFFKTSEEHHEGHVELNLTFDSKTLRQDLLTILKQDIKLIEHDLNSLKTIEQKIDDELLKLDIAEILLKNNDDYGSLILKRLSESEDNFIKDEALKKLKGFNGEGLH